MKAALLAFVIAFPGLAFADGPVVAGCVFTEKCDQPGCTEVENGRLAVRFLGEMAGKPTATVLADKGLFQGPEMSGRSRMFRDFTDSGIGTLQVYTIGQDEVTLSLGSGRWPMRSQMLSVGLNGESTVDAVLTRVHGIGMLEVETTFSGQCEWKGS